MDLGISGLASGFDWRTFVDQMVAVEQTPETQMRAEQSTLNGRNDAYGSLKTQLSALQDRLANLKSPTFFGARLPQSSDATIATPTADANAPLGQYSFHIINLATAARQLGSSNIGKPIDPSQLITNAAFARPITPGTFTVNGKQIIIAATDTVQAVLDKISNSGAGVTATFDSAADKFKLTSASPIVLGSATDTSNFLQVAKLTNNGPGAISSTGMLGGIRPTGSLSAANLATAVSDGGAGAGEFKINNVSISFNAGADSLTNVIDRINNSAAGVTASYDSINDRMTLTSNVTGDMGIALGDVSGNFLAATGLLGGGSTLQRGSDLQYTLNGGTDVLTSQNNTISSDSSGIAGLQLTVLKPGDVTVGVASDTTTIKQAIKDFVDDYNKLQSMIDTQTASSTDATGKVTAGILATDGGADAIGSALRSIANSMSSSGLGNIKGLDDLGIISGGFDNKLTLSDESKLDKALANNLNGVQALFSDTTAGLSVKLGAYIDKTIGDNGTLISTQDNLTKQASAIDTQIADLERLIASDRQRMIDSFVAMEAAQAKTNQQLQFINQKFGLTSTNTSTGA